MTYLLDTTTFSALMRRAASVRAKISNLTISDRAVICAVARGEILYGIERLPLGKRRRDLEVEAGKIFHQLDCVAVPEEAGDHFAAIKSATESRGTPLDENDLWIAATALSLNAVLVSTDSDFQRVGVLRLENWA